MAFIFVPNADGSFTEGDKQTNSDTGVEYIYSDGAWRALGPKIENEFDTLDERYVNKSGDTMSGQLTIENSRNFAMKKADGSTQFEMRPNVNAADYFTNIYSYNAGGMRFRVATGQNAGTYDTMISLTGETQTIGSTNYRGTAYINRVRTPTNLDHAVNKYYVDNAIENIDIPDVNLSDYLPLAGGTMTGRLTIEQPRTDSNTNCFVIKGRIRDGSNNLTEGILLKSYKRQNSSTSADYLAYYGESGGDNELLNRKTAQEEFASKSDLDNITLDNYLPLSGGTLTGTLTGQLLKSIRTGGGYAIEVKPGDTDTKAFIRTDGTSKLSTLTVESPMSSAGQRAFEIKGRLSDGSTVSKDFFYMYTNADGTASAMNYDGKMNSTKNLVNYGFVTNKVPGRFYVQNGSLFYEA